MGVQLPGSGSGAGRSGSLEMGFSALPCLHQLLDGGSLGHSTKRLRQESTDTAWAIVWRILNLDGPSNSLISVKSEEPNK